MQLPITILMIAISLSASAQPFSTDYEQFLKSAKEEKYKDCIDKGNKLLTTVRYPTILYKLAECYCQVDSIDKSLNILQELAIKGLPYDISTNTKLDKLTTQKQYQNLLKKFATNGRSVQSSENAFTLNDARLIPEGIAATADGNRFFVGSLAQHKIVEYDRHAGQKDLIPSDQNGIWMVLGMKISADGKSIWVCSASEKDPFNGYSGIFGFDITTGAPINKYILDNKTTTHLFNDLVIAADNNIYFTDSKDGKVFKLDRKAGLVTPLVKHEFIYPNGIALDEKRNSLYVADRTGITIIDLHNNAVTTLETQVPGFLNYIDGLYFYNNSLIGIQNSGNDKDRIVRLYLNKSGKKIERIQVLESFLPDYIEPTTGTIVNNEFYYIAISHVSNLQPDGTITNPNQLKKPLIKKIRLN